MTCDAALAAIRRETAIVPEVGIILGSGLGALADEIAGVAIPYGDIPGFPCSTAPEHRGVLHIGHLRGRAVVAMQGRVHLYEGYTPAQVAFPVEVLAALGIRTLVLTNAAGTLAGRHEVGSFVIVEDHLSLANLAGLDPARGAPPQAGISRFVSLNRAYDPDLIATARAAGATVGEALAIGVYAFVTGPCFETPTEVRLLEMAGWSLVGMSTVPEVLAARRFGLRILGLSAVTNAAVSDIGDTHVTTAEEVWANAERMRPRALALLRAILAALPGAGRD